MALLVHLHSIGPGPGTTEDRICQLYQREATSSISTAEAFRLQHYVGKTWAALWAMNAYGHLPHELAFLVSSEDEGFLCNTGDDALKPDWMLLSNYNDLLLTEASYGRWL